MLLDADEDLCGLCSEHTCSYWCEDCAKWLCSRCKSIHLKLALDKPHTIKSVDEVCNEVRKKLDELTSPLRDRLSEQKQNLDALSQAIQQQEKEQEKSLEESKQLRLKLIDNLNKSFDLIDSRISNIGGQHNRSLTDVKLRKQREFDFLSFNVNRLAEKFDQNNLSLAMKGQTLLDMASTLDDATLKGDAIAIHETTVDLTKNTATEINDELTMKLYDANTGGKLSLRDLAARKFTMLVAVDLEQIPISVLEINEELWCLEFFGVIEIFDNDLRRTRKLNNAVWGHVRDVIALPNDKLVLSGSNGLFEIKSSGEVIRKIASGNFLSCSYVDNKVHGFTNCEWEHGEICTPIGPDVEETSGIIHGFIYSPDQRVSCPQQNDDALKMSTGERSHTIRTREDLIYACSSDEHVIHVLPFKDRIYPQLSLGSGFFESTVVTSYGKFGSKAPGELFQPRLGAVDDDGTLLIADEMNNRLQVVDKDSQWTVLDLEPPVLYPLGAVTSGQKLYVVSKGNGNKLTLYV